MTANVKETAGGITFDVKAQPGSSKNEITGFKDGVLKVKISAAPDKGKANKELVDFLSSVFGVRKTAVTVIKGEKSRNKSVMISGITKKDFETKLGGVL
jgi:uncharacterized protein (TIGR00251 family)